MSFLELLAHNVEVQRAATADDSAGGDDVTYSTHIASMPARIRESKGAYQRELRGEAQNITHVMYFPRSRDVQRGDRIVYDSDTFEVVGLASIFGGQQKHHHEAQMRRLE